MQKITSQANWIARAGAVLPGATFGNFANDVLIDRGQGARIWDADGKEYVDYLIGSGPMLLGHGHPEVVEAVLQQVPRGMTFFTTNTAGIELAEEIVRAVPCAQQVRFVASGGEADMYAIRLARAATGRDKIIKFEGGFHGMSAEALMSLSPSARVNFPQAVPDSAGIPNAVRDQMLIAPFNDLAFLRGLLAEHGPEVAAVIVEPLQRVVAPEAGFLEGLRAECDRHGVLLIFDEVVTGFRLDYGGAQERWGVVPDICALGKVIGGGFPVAALAASADLMAHFDKAAVDDARWLIQFGTLSGFPVGAVAGLKTLEILRRDGQYDRLKANGQRLCDMQTKALNAAGVAHRIVGDVTLFDVVFTQGEVRDYRSYQIGDAAKAATYNQVLRENGVFKLPGKFYPSLALSEADFEVTEAAVDKAVAAIAG